MSLAFSDPSLSGHGVRRVARAMATRQAVSLGFRAASLRVPHRISRIRCTSSTSMDASSEMAQKASLVDLRVGRITHIEKHPDADTLYVEQVDVGEEEPRTIVSGLVKFVSEEEMLGSLVVVMANLKPRNMRGIKSAGMLLCASNEAHDVVEPLRPAEGSALGERIGFGEDFGEMPEPATPNQLQKKKIWEEVQPSFTTTEECQATCCEMILQTTAGPVTCKSLVKANVS